MSFGTVRPSNAAVAEGKPRVQHLSVHHGKSGHGLGIDFEVKRGPVTLLNLTQPGSDEGLRLIYTLGEVLPGAVLNIGNPNCRVRVERPIHEFIDAWCQHGPAHHIALGIGHHGPAIETFAETMGFEAVRV